MRIRINIHLRLLKNLSVSEISSLLFSLPLGSEQSRQLRYGRLSSKKTHYKINGYLSCPVAQWCLDTALLVVLAKLSVRRALVSHYWALVNLFGYWKSMGTYLLPISTIPLLTQIEKRASKRTKHPTSQSSGESDPEGDPELKKPDPSKTSIRNNFRILCISMRTKIMVRNHIKKRSGVSNSWSGTKFHWSGEKKVGLPDDWGRT